MICHLIASKRCTVVVIGASHNKTLPGCSEQIAMEGQDLPRTYLARHELESVICIIIIFIIIIIIMSDQSKLLFIKTFLAGQIRWCGGAGGAKSGCTHLWPKPHHGKTALPAAACCLLHCALSQCHVVLMFLLDAV